MRDAWQCRQPPDNEVPGAIGSEVVLVRTDELVVFVLVQRAYSNGVDLTLEVRTRRALDGWADIEDQVLFGVEFADGRGCMLQGFDVDNEKEEDQPMLSAGGGSAGTRNAETEVFLSPLPPPGELRFICAWPDRGVPETTVAVPADPILQAASRAQQLWPWEPEPPEPGVKVPRPAVPPGSWFAAHLHGLGTPDQ